MKSTFSSWPDWDDAGKKVDIELTNGEKHSGVLEIDDFFPDGEGDEVPVFKVTCEDGSVKPFTNVACWQFKD